MRYLTLVLIVSLCLPLAAKTSDDYIIANNYGASWWAGQKTFKDVNIIGDNVLSLRKGYLDVQNVRVIGSNAFSGTTYAELKNITIDGEFAFRFASTNVVMDGRINSNSGFYFAENMVVFSREILGNNLFNQAKNLFVFVPGRIGEIVNPVNGIIIADKIDKVVFDLSRVRNNVELPFTPVKLDPRQHKTYMKETGTGMLGTLLDTFKDISVGWFTDSEDKFVSESLPMPVSTRIIARKVLSGGEYVTVLNDDAFLAEVEKNVKLVIKDRRMQKKILREFLFTVKGQKRMLKPTREKRDRF